jgi:hypothetical protein
MNVQAMTSLTHESLQFRMSRAFDDPIYIETHRSLGHGAFGKVYLARATSASPPTLAVKSIPTRADSIPVNVAREVKYQSLASKQLFDPST